MESKKLVLGAIDATTARICKQLGADYIWASSLVSSAMVGRKDDGIFDARVLSSFINSLKEGFDSIIVDFDIGGRDLNELKMNAKAMKDLGVKGVCIEDENYPKLNAMLVSDKPRLIESDKMAQKISIFKEELNGSAMVIARTHSLIDSESKEQLQARVYKYIEAGADILVIHYTQSDWKFYSQTIKSIDCNKPIMLILSKENRVPIEIMELDKIKYINFPNQIYRKMIYSMINLNRKNILSGKNWENLISINELFKLI